MPYTKLPLTFAAQLDLLCERGLQVADRDRALRWLAHISYYRLSAYFLPFKEGEAFRPGTTFNDIAGLYIFDRKLRLVMLDAIERIEVAIRTTVTYEIAHTYGVFGHTHSEHFSSQFDHMRFMDDLAKEKDRAEKGRATETFVTHFQAKYPDEPYLPIWMATELLSFGATSKLYSSLQPKAIRQRIAAPYKVDAKILTSWLHTLAYIRNVCAHQKRLWNRELAIAPRLPSRCREWPHQVPDEKRLYAVLIIVRHMLAVASPHTHWHHRLFDLLDQHPTIPTQAMGFPPQWKDLVAWRERT